jgi:hypothetical protein
MGVLSVGCVISVDHKEDCKIVRLVDGYSVVRSLLIKPPYVEQIQIGDSLVYTTDSDVKRILSLGIQNNVNEEILTLLEILKSKPFEKTIKL